MWAPGGFRVDSVWILANERPEIRGEAPFGSFCRRGAIQPSESSLGMSTRASSTIFRLLKMVCMFSNAPESEVRKWFLELRKWFGMIKTCGCLRGSQRTSFDFNCFPRCYQCRSSIIYECFRGHWGWLVECVLSQLDTTGGGFR